MIVDFGDETTRDIYDGDDTRAARKVPKPLWNVARRKLDLLNGVHALRDLGFPAGNRLEKLKGGLAEKYSIRINDQYRIVFKFADGNVQDVRITDYHS